MPNISRSKGSQTMKFGQFMEYNLRNIFLEKLWTEFRETITRPFSKNIKIEYISGSMVWSFTQFVFIIWQVQGYRNILKLNCRPLVFTSFKAFLKRDQELVPLANFLNDFMKKIISVVIYSIISPTFIVWLLLFCEIVGNICVAIFC